MAWTTPRTWVANEILTAALLNTHLRDNFNELDVAKITGAGDYIVASGANALTARQYDGYRLDAQQTTTSSTYTDLATVGPTVTLTTGTNAMIFMSSRLDNNTANVQSKVSYAVSGATTSAADDTRSILRDGLPASNAVHYGTVDYRTNLTAGSNTFTMKYASDGAATATFYNRFLLVMPL